MQSRQRSWPKVWLMTDERLGDRLWTAIERVPDAAGIVFRHYSLPVQERVKLACRVAAVTRKRGLTLSIAADARLARQVGADIVHNPATAARGMPFSRSVHDLEESYRARLDGAAIVFVSPVHSTRSHAGQPPLGPELAIRLARAAGVPAIALGGMNASNFAQLEREGFYGWAGIDAWLEA